MVAYPQHGNALLVFVAQMENPSYIWETAFWANLQYCMQASIKFQAIPRIMTLSRLEKILILAASHLNSTRMAV